MSKPQFKLFAILMLLCTSPPVFAQDTMDSGTIIAVYRTDDTLYVAADSRRMISPPDNKACKIIPLGDHAFFTATGHVLPDAVIQAKKTFDEMPTQDIGQVAEQWAKIMKQSYLTFAEKDPKGFAYANPPMWRTVTGIFGSSAGNRMQIYRVNIGYHLSPNPEDEENFIPSFSSYIWGPKTKFPLLTYGVDDKELVTEFWHRDTQHAREAMDDAIKNIPSGTSPADREGMLLNAAVQYALDSPTHSDLVEGPVDILELPKSRESFWVKIKPGCENGGQVKKP